MWKKVKYLGKFTADLRYGAGTNEGAEPHNSMDDRIREDSSMNGNNFSSDYNTNTADGNPEQELREDLDLLDDYTDKELKDR